MARVERRSATWWLVGLAAVLMVFHVAFGNRYGFHRDELQFLDDARHLQWGYVPFPPMTSWLGRVSVAMFGGILPAGPLALRLPAMVIASVIVVIAGLIARALGGSRFAQVLAALLMMALELAMGQWLMYVITDNLAWAVVALCVAKLLQTRDGRWWLGVGAGVGFGILSKYSVAFLVGSLLLGVVALPGERVWLRSKWLWAGAGVAVLIALPNLLWEWRHGWVTFAMLKHIHARDVRMGRANGYWTDQLKYLALALPFAVAGVVWLARNARYRLLLFLYAGPLVLFAVAKGRGYYAIPGFVSVYAAGAVWFAQWTEWMRARLTLRAVAVGFAVTDCVLVTLMMGGVAPQGSRLLNFQLRTNSDVRDQFGWPEMAAAVARARDTLPPEQRAVMDVAVDNYGEAGAIAQFGPQLGLPYPISSANDFYDRGYARPNAPNGPEVVATLGIGRKDRARLFERCEVRAQFVKPNSVGNDDEEGQPVYVCWGMRTPWSVLWATERSFG